MPSQGDRGTGSAGPLVASPWGKPRSGAGGPDKPALGSPKRA